MVYRLVDALCGDAGAGSLKKGTFLDRLSGALEGLHFATLDYVFGGMGFLARTESEAYEYDPEHDMLTSDQWDEVRIKDAWYRARIREFFIACGQGGTPNGLRMAIHAATSVDCDVYETWRYHDNFGIRSPLGRAPGATRNEVVLAPHKTALTPREFRLAREMVRRIAPVDIIVTVNTGGLAVNLPVPIKTAAADSSYFEVQKEITGSPVLADLPPPEVLAIDLRPSEQWLLTGDKSLAPYAAFNITQEYGYYYLMGGGARSPIDSVEYGTLRPDGEVVREPAFEAFRTSGQYTPWIEYERADSPDNYPGGKFGVHPDRAPAQNPDGTDYLFPYGSQAEYVQSVLTQVLAAGGQADTIRYRLPIVVESTSKKVYSADLAVAYNPPVRDSTVTSNWSLRENRTTDSTMSLGAWVGSGNRR